MSINNYIQQWAYLCENEDIGEQQDTGLHDKEFSYDELYKAISEDPEYVSRMLMLVIDQNDAEYILKVMKNGKMDTNASRHLHQFLRNHIKWYQDYNNKTQSDMHKNNPNLVDDPERLGRDSHSNPHEKHEINGPKGDLPK